MTIQETGTIMDILAAAYPKFYSSRDVDMKNVMKLWATMFAEDDVRIVAAAVGIDSQITTLGIAVKQKITAVVGRGRHKVHDAIDGHLSVRRCRDGRTGIGRVGRLLVKKTRTRGESHQHKRQ